VLRLILHSLLAFLPGWLKIPVYRHFCGYEIGTGVRIGVSPLVVHNCRIDDGARIGHLNLFWKTHELIIEDHARIGHLNLFRGGSRIVVGRYAEILRTNVINSIPEPDAETELRAEFHLGAGSVITTGHWVDFTDAVTIGVRSILGGRHSSLWTHSRQWTRPISIGNFVYLGSEVRLAPGATVPSYCVVGLGSVVIDAIRGSGLLIAGNPARRIKTLNEDGLRLLTRKTRPGLPDDVGAKELESIPWRSTDAGELLESVKQA